MAFGASRSEWIVIEFKAVGICAPWSSARAHAQRAKPRNIDSYPSLMHTDLRAEAFCSGSQRRHFIDTQILFNNIRRCCAVLCFRISLKAAAKGSKIFVDSFRFAAYRPPREFCWLTALNPSYSEGNFFPCFSTFSIDERKCKYLEREKTAQQFSINKVSKSANRKCNEFLGILQRRSITVFWNQNCVQVNNYLKIEENVKIVAY